MNSIKFIDEAKPNPGIYGGKGSSLIKMHQLGINIPPGFILPINLYNEFLKQSGLNKQLLKILPEDYLASETLKISNEVKELFLDSEIPKQIYEEIKSKFKKFQRTVDKQSMFAVRSSANIEDSIEFSFAGQAKTILFNRNLEDIILSLKECWASLFSAPALLYLYQMKKRGKKVVLYDIKMGIIIQKMIDADIAGVLFTVNVVNYNQNQMMINSTWGLGDTITDNKVIPDVIVLNKSDGSVLKLRIGEKETRSIANPKGVSTILVNNEERFRKVCSVNQKQIHKLYVLGLKLEKTLEAPQDIEWAIKNNEIYILQSRPITTLK